MGTLVAGSCSLPVDFYNCDDESEAEDDNEGDNDNEDTSEGDKKNRFKEPGDVVGHSYKTKAEGLPGAAKGFSGRLKELETDNCALRALAGGG